MKIRKKYTEKKTDRKENGKKVNTIYNTNYVFVVIKFSVKGSTKV